MSVEALHEKPAQQRALARGAGCAHFVRMFKPRFAEMVENGTKLQTVRPTPKRMPHPGDTISLRCWTGLPYRSKQRVIRESIIAAVRLIEIDTCAITIDGVRLRHLEEEEFAMADGFSGIIEMTDWFREQHDLPFRGVVISWHNNPVSESAKPTSL